MSKVKDKTGEIKYNNFGSKMKIIKYLGCEDIDVYFEEYDYIKRHTTYGNFKKGLIKCPYERRECNIGYIGEGKYTPKTHKHIYDKWRAMITRCYSNKQTSKRRTYKNCEVCKEWHNFQNFAKWYEENYYTISNQVMHLDKDILIKGNKIYSPNTCIFVPEKINILFVKADKIRGSLPIGVSWDKNINKYRSYYYTNNKRITIGFYDTPEVAFQSYKIAKEKHIKEIAEEYKDLIPIKLYNALYEYKVEIND